MSKLKKPAMGKGLGALLGHNDANIVQVESNNALSNSSGSVKKISISNIEANPFQPRTHFDKEALDELTESVAQFGIIQPITVRPLGANKYQIISGERRFRAAQSAGLKEVPVYILEADDQAMLEMAIIENVQRKDLNALEVALSYQRLMDECNLTQEEVGVKVSKSRSAVANFLRLLHLPEAIQIGVRDNKISMGHARALLSFEDEKEMLKTYLATIENQWSVRKVEELASLNKEKNKSNKAQQTQKINVSKSLMQRKDQIAFHLGSKIQFSPQADGSGKLTISYKDEEHLNKIIDLLDR